MHTRKWIFGMLIAGGVSLLVGCTGGQTLPQYRVTTGGHANAGKQVIQEFRCGACHTIPGINDANGVFAPPLTHLGARTYLAGRIANTPANLVRWIMSPQSVKPKTAMPQLGLTQEQARNVAAYLYTLQ